MMPNAELYADLGLEPSADEGAVRQAFRRLAFDLHPDRNPDPDAARAFVRARAAYETLTSPARREAAEAEEVVAAVLRAAASAAPPRAPRPLHFILERSGRGLPPERARRVASVLALAGAVAVGPAMIAGSIGLLLVSALSLAAAAAVWLTRRLPNKLALYGDGFEDGRWPGAGRIRWGDVYALDPDLASGTLDLALSKPVAERLVRLFDRPRGALVWAGDRPFYRLPVGRGLEGVSRAVEARSGLSAR